LEFVGSAPLELKEGMKIVALSMKRLLKLGMGTSNAKERNMYFTN
jgi:hypothetical protein